MMTREFAEDPIYCGDRCFETFNRGGISDGNNCYCFLCAAAVTRPEFFRSAGCASYISSLKVGHNKIFEKFYGVRNGRYYYC